MVPDETARTDRAARLEQDLAHGDMGTGDVGTAVDPVENEILHPPVVDVMELQRVPTILLEMPAINLVHQDEAHPAQAIVVARAGVGDGRGEFLRQVDQQRRTQGHDQAVDGHEAGGQFDPRRGFELGVLPGVTGIQVAHQFVVASLQSQHDLLARLERTRRAQRQPAVAALRRGDGLGFPVPAGALEIQQPPDPGPLGRRRPAGVLGRAGLEFLERLREP